MKTNCIYLILAVALLLSCKNTESSNGDQSEKISYDVVFRDDVAGKYEKWKTGEGSFEYYYTYTDRGRGPEYDERITLDENGFIKKQSIEGVNYRKVPIAESFSGTDSSASWSNPKETKQGDFYGSELYFRFDGSPAVYEILAQLLLNAEDGKIGLYPIGEAELVKTSVETLSDSTRLDLLMIKGLDMKPAYLWMKDNEMVARISGNLHVIRQDFKSQRLALKKIQDTAEDAYLMEITKSLTHPIDQVVIQNVNVFTATGTLLSNQDVFIGGERIDAIVPTGKKKFQKARK